MRTRTALTTGLAALSLLVLAACSPGGGGTDDGPAPDDGASTAGGVADCLPGTWELDAEANARALQEFLTGNGMAVTSAESSGGVHLTVTDERMTYVSDVSYVMTVAMGDGLEMIVSQLQTGESSGAWAVEGDQVVFSDWEEGMEFTTSVTIGGQSADMPFDLPAGDGGGVETAVTCDGDLLSTQPEGSPFLSVWTRVD